MNNEGNVNDPVGRPSRPVFCFDQMIARDADGKCMACDMDLEDCTPPQVFAAIPGQWRRCPSCGSLRMPTPEIRQASFTKPRQAARNGDLGSRYHMDLAAAFVLGSMRKMTQEQLVVAGQAAGLKLQRFKRMPQLPRVTRVIELLLELQPKNLLDIGGGSGSSLIVLLEEFPGLEIDVIDADEARVQHLRALARGLGHLDLDLGTPRLTARMMDATDLEFENDIFDVVTGLEVLEHLDDPERAVAEMLRVARRVVIVSVPDRPDTNPRHVQFLAPDRLEALLLAHGARAVRFASVPGHTIAVAQKGACRGAEERGTE